MEKSLISVIVPIYNVSRYLERCMESLLHQTYKNIEIIMVDDDRLKLRPGEKIGRTKD